MNKSKYTFIAGVLISSLSIGQITTDITPSQDNTIYSNNASNANGLGDIYSGQNCSNHTRRALIKFDLSIIPSDATITGVSLKVNVNNTSSAAGSGNTTYNIHPLTKHWGEGGSSGGGQGALALAPDATWTEAVSGGIVPDPWNTNGGDYLPSSLSTVDFTISNTDYTFPTTTLFTTKAQSWLNTPSTNFGLILIGDETQACTLRRLGSKEKGTAPILAVTWEQATNTATIKQSNVTIYPNPTNGNVTVDLGKSNTEATVKVFSIDGRLVETENLFNSTQHIIHLNRPSGIYFVQVTTKTGQTKTFRVLKK